MKPIPTKVPFSTGVETGPLIGAEKAPALSVHSSSENGTIATRRVSPHSFELGISVLSGGGRVKVE